MSAPKPSPDHAEDVPPAEVVRPNRRERRGGHQQQQSFGKVAVRGQSRNAPSHRDYATRRRG
jgi:hypothetical protein